MEISSSGKTLGAAVKGIDLAQPLSDRDCERILRALGAYGVLCFPDQRLETQELARFGRMFGELEINIANQFHEPGFPEVMVLSNMRVDGDPAGLADAGQGWHTDMSYSAQIALASVLHAIRVPTRDGRPLGDTQFRNMHAAYADLPGEIKQRLAGRTATHDFAKFWDMMRSRSGSRRPPLTAAQRAKKPPVSQGVFRTHPITGRTVLYCNPGYAMRIDGMDEAESAEMLDFLFRHQEQEKYFYAHHWREGDVLMWDNVGTVHNAVADYGPDQPRYMRRVQVMASNDCARATFDEVGSRRDVVACNTSPRRGEVGSRLRDPGEGDRGEPAKP